MTEATDALGPVQTEPLWRIRLRLAWQGLKKNWALFAENKIGIIGLVIIVFFALMAVAHPILMATVWDAKIYNPVIGYDEIMIEKEVVEVVTDPATQVQIEIAQLDYFHLNPQVGDTITILEQPAPPSREHLLGTDPLGRDVLSQLMYSTSSEFMLGIVAALVTVIIATTVGAVAAYYGGLVDTIFMRVADLLIIMPLIPVLILMGALINLELIHLAIIIGVLSGLGGTTLIIKSQALTVKVKPFIEAAKVAGGSHWHIIFTHLIPNLLPLSFLYMMFTVTTAIFLEAVLSFFGLMDVNMSWGLMINIAQSQGYLLSGTRYWWLLFPAGAAITFLCSAFYLVGRALDEVVNPRLRQR
ncbi:ABC transporter permease subunit [Chloroflexota bacterium]